MSPDLAAPPCPHNGDVNGDGVVSAADAQLALNFTLQILYPPFPWEVCAVDCNGDGIMSAGDAQLIFWTALEMGTCLDALPAAGRSSGPAGTRPACQRHQAQTGDR